MSQHNSYLDLSIGAVIYGQLTGVLVVNNHQPAGRFPPVVPLELLRAAPSFVKDAARH